MATAISQMPESMGPVCPNPHLSRETMTMILSDGECPNCSAPELHLNTDDLFECPQCHLLCSCADGLIAGVMPLPGIGEMRPGPVLARFDGVGFAKTFGGSVMPDLASIFTDRAALAEYLRKGIEVHSEPLKRRLRNPGSRTNRVVGPNSLWVSDFI